jgi:hypothetical protein
MLMHSALPGATWNANAKMWFDTVLDNIDASLVNLQSKGRLNEFAKWTWFAKRFHAGLERLGPILSATGISLERLSRSIAR